ncbi:MAG: hypothetical protein IMW89_20385 [Ktedonobacteraceae bacterium]|nr:hypothetical protein [Ktedonobacteraceae bacterium]
MTRPGACFKKKRREEQVGQSQETPVIPLNQGSLRAINSALLGYLASLKVRRPIPSQTIQQVQSIRLKLAPFLKPGGFPEGVVLSLSRDQMQLVEEALQSLHGQIRQKIPPSQERDEVLRELEKLRNYLRESLARGKL